jgi:thiamine transport system substrate-binding protein
MKKRFQTGRGVPAVLAAVILAAFGAGTAFAGGGREENAAGQDARALTVYTYDAFPEAIEEAIVSHFSARGVTVSLQRFEDTGGLYNQLFLERENPKADVAIGLDNTYLGPVTEHRLLAPYRPENIAAVDESLIVDPEFRAIPFDFGRIGFNYDSVRLPDPPETWEELLSPEYAGKIVIPSPVTSSPGRNFLLFTIAKFGEDRYLEFWRRLRPNILTVTSGWSDAYGLYTQGEAPIVLSYDTSPAYHIEFENERRYKNLVLDGEAYAQIEVAGIVAGTRKPELARELIEYLLSPEVQSLVPLHQVMHPVRTDLELPASFREIETGQKVRLLDYRTVAENIDRWIEDWERVMRER